MACGVDFGIVQTIVREDRLLKPLKTACYFSSNLSFSP